MTTAGDLFVELVAQGRLLLDLDRTPFDLTTATRDEIGDRADTLTAIHAILGGLARRAAQFDAHLRQLRDDLAGLRRVDLARKLTGLPPDPLLVEEIAKVEIELAKAVWGPS